MTPRSCLVCATVCTSVLLLSGCTAWFSIPTTYEAYPVSVQYTLRYGYVVTATGSGKYDVRFACDVPELLRGSVSFEALYPSTQTVMRANNSVLLWNLSELRTGSFSLGIEATATAHSVMLADLSGKGALTVGQLSAVAPSLVQQYTRAQGNDSVLYIDPADPQVDAAVASLGVTSDSNALTVAVGLFRWLKENIQYRFHPEDGAQPTHVTLARGEGDCDDLSFLYVSLCRAAGIPARFIRGYLLSEDGTAVAHAWVEVYVGGGLVNEGWVPVECACCVPLIETDIQQNFGMEDALHLRLFLDDGSNDSFDAAFAGLTYITYGLSRSVTVEPFIEVTSFAVLEERSLVVDGTRRFE